MCGSLNAGGNPAMHISPFGSTSSYTQNTRKCHYMPNVPTDERLAFKILGVSWTFIFRGRYGMWSLYTASCELLLANWMKDQIWWRGSILGSHHENLEWCMLVSSSQRVPGRNQNVKRFIKLYFLTHSELKMTWDTRGGNKIKSVWEQDRTPIHRVAAHCM